MERSKSHWGDWILARSQFVGFKRKKDFAVAVGCSDNQLTKWLQMDAPPGQMRKGFDLALANALQITKHVLFQQYLEVSPESAPFEDIGFDFMRLSGRHDVPDWKPVEITLLKAMDLMYLAELERVTEYAMQLILSQNDDRRQTVEKMAAQFSAMMTAKFGRRHPLDTAEKTGEKKSR